MDSCSVHFFYSSREDLPIDMAGHWFILKNEEEKKGLNSTLLLFKTDMRVYFYGLTHV